MQTTLQAIDRTLSANLATEPSAQLVANVRQSIAARPHGAAAWRRWSAWATAAGLCAAFAILLLVARTSRNFNRPVHNSVAVQTNPPSASKLAANAHPNTAVVAGTAARSHNRGIVVARHASLRMSHAKAAEPEVIIQPGQMQAILQLVAAAQRGKVNGADLFASQKNSANPLEIKPLTIVPLRISPSKDDSESSSPSSSQDWSISVTRQSN